MSKIYSKIIRFIGSEDGPTTVEYAIILAVIAVTISGSLVFLGDAVTQVYGTITSTIDSVL